MAIVPRSRVVTAAAAAAGAAVALAAPLPVHAADRAAGNRFRVVRLVADQPGHARTTDPDLVNAWGLAASPTSPIWVSNNGTSTSTLYQGATTASDPVTKVPLTVTIPGGGAPTGVVFNPTPRFQLHQGGKSGPAAFVFAGEDGDLFGWNPTGDPAMAVQVGHRDNTVYKGLARVRMGGRPMLLAANFHQDRVDVFNARFHRVVLPHAFPSRRVPDGYAPFNVAKLGHRVYVTYAKQDASRTDDVAGKGHGFLNVFSPRGRFLGSLVRRGVLNSPWGLAIAPSGFGPFSGRLLVGNFGNGRIHVVNRRTGHVVATLRDRTGAPVRIDGLWGLLPGNGTAGGRSDVWFSAGPADESHGLLGILRHP
ncbi:MAG: hypothetical protein QOK15_230 [Nocardioidaceae bacterium]|jgi:uncharacterized protein (TIGR03118 family)|nr:hypothetical protein [Nocardioidaceae bacterium]